MSQLAAVYPPATVRLVEIRLLDGPSLHRLFPAVKVEVAVGDEATWSGDRDAAQGVATWLWEPVQPGARPVEVSRLADLLERLAPEAGELAVDGQVVVQRAADPGHWVVSYPWTSAEAARTLAETAARLLAVAGTPVEQALAAAHERLAAAAITPSSPPAWIRDRDRRIPVVSISGTNGKSTVTRLVAYILSRAGRRVGMTTSDGIVADDRLVEPGDWTGPGGARAILGRSGLDVAVLETARGGILLRGVGYESNEAAVLTNVSSDHLDLQGIHTLAELAAAKATIARITRPGGWVVLNADDAHVAAIAGLVAARVAFFGLDLAASPLLRDHVERGGRAFLLRRDVLVEVEAGSIAPICAVDEVPIALGGLARHNVANALAAAGAARALGATLAEIADGLRDFRPTAARSPGRLNFFRLGRRIVIVDFAHNEAGIEVLLDVAQGIAAGGSARTLPVTIIVGAAGDRPADTLRGIGRIAARRAQRVAIKETLTYVRDRPRDWIVGEIRAGIGEAGVAADRVPVYETEVEALRAELTGAAGAGDDGRPDSGRVVALMCHEEREAVFTLLNSLGARPLESSAELRSLVPRAGR